MYSLFIESGLCYKNYFLLVKQMSKTSRWEYFKAIYHRYQQAGKAFKQAILNEFCANTGYHRKYAIRKLKGPLPQRPTTPPPTPPRLHMSQQ